MIKIKIAGKKYCTKLSVFDFDGTLFKSPDKPEGYKGNWWVEKKSLNPPTVPEKPGDEFWNLEVVEAARKELEDPKNCVILMTGRVNNVFHERITELVGQKGLNFKHIWCNDFGRSTGEFKLEKIHMLLKQNKSIKKIEMWEDEPDKVELYTDELSNKYQFKINKIQGREK